MRRFSFMGLVVALITTLFGLAGIAPASAQTISITSSATATATSQVDSVVRALVAGATQVTWENPNHTVKVTMAQVRKAPHIVTSCTAANRRTQSQDIYRRTRGASVVVVMPGSCLWNRGMKDRIRVGFKWRPKVPAVLKLTSGHRYRHVFNVVGSRLVKTCANYIGGPVDVYVPHVVQVQYAADVLVDITVSAHADATATANGSLVCPSGTLTGSASATAVANARETIRVKASMRLSASQALRIKLEQQVKIKASADAKASAEAKITLTCSEAPPPPAPKATVTVNEGNDVDITDPNCEGGRDECESYALGMAHVDVPEGVTGVASLNSNAASAMFSNNTRGYADDFARANLSSGHYDLEIRLSAGTEMPSYGCTKPGLPAGTKCYKLTIIFTPAGGGDPVTAFTEFVANPVVKPPM